jgi:hypothetical protein
MIPPWLSSNPIELYQQAAQNLARNDIAGAQMTQQMFQEQAQLQQRRQEEARQAAQQLIQNDLAQQAFKEAQMKARAPQIRSGNFGVVAVDPFTGAVKQLASPPQKVAAPIFRSGPFGVVKIDPLTGDSSVIVQPPAKPANKPKDFHEPGVGVIGPNDKGDYELKYKVPQKAAPRAKVTLTAKNEDGSTESITGDPDEAAVSSFRERHKAKPIDEVAQPENPGWLSQGASYLGNAMDSVSQKLAPAVTGSIRNQLTDRISSALGIGSAPAAIPQAQAKPALATPQSKADLDLIPSGTLFVNPADGKTYRKK